MILLSPRLITWSFPAHFLHHLVAFIRRIELLSWCLRITAKSLKGRLRWCGTPSLRSPTPITCATGTTSSTSSWWGRRFTLFRTRTSFRQIAGQGVAPIWRGWPACPTSSSSRTSTTLIRSRFTRSWSCAGSSSRSGSGFWSISFSWTLLFRLFWLLICKFQIKTIFFKILYYQFHIKRYNFIYLKRNYHVHHDHRHQMVLDWQLEIYPGFQPL